MVPSLAVLWDRGLDVLGTFFDQVTGTLLANLGNARAEEQTSDGAEVWQWWGFVSRPPAPRGKTGASQAIVLRGAGRDAVIGARDLRANELYRTLAEGETCLYAAGAKGEGRARVVLRGDGRVDIFTGSTGAELRVALDAEAGALRLEHPKGHALVLDENGIHLSAGGASLTLDAGGAATLSGARAALVKGPKVLLGLEEAAAVPAVNSAVIGAGGLLTTASAHVFIAP